MILVTGGLGFMGSAFIRLLFEQDKQLDRVINLDNMTYAANPKSVETIENDSRYVFVRGSILDKELLENIYQEYPFETIVHFAAETHVDNSIVSPSQFVETNIVGTFTLLEFVKEHPSIRFHLISTDEVYGSLSHDGHFTETSPYQPNSPYSASKAAADHLAYAYYKTYQLNITISHASNNYGPFQHKEKFIPLMIDRMVHKQPLPIYGLGINVRDWLFVEDHAKAVLAILQKGRPGEIYNIGGENEWRNIDLVYMLIDLYASFTQENREELLELVEFVKDRPGHDFRYALSNKKIKEMLHWSVQITMQKGLEQTLQWYLNEQKQDCLSYSR